MTVAPDQREDNATQRALWGHALRYALALAQARYPEGGARLHKGYALAAAGHVTLGDHGTADVVSQTGTGSYQVVGASCTCEDSARGKICKHRWAKVLDAKATALLAAAVQEAGGDPGAVCPACGYATVVTVPLYHKQRQTYDDFQVCRFVLRLDARSYACGWGERVCPQP